MELWTQSHTYVRLHLEGSERERGVARKDRAWDGGRAKLDRRWQGQAEWFSGSPRKASETIPCFEPSAGLRNEAAQSIKGHRWHGWS